MLRKIFKTYKYTSLTPILPLLLCASSCAEPSTEKYVMVLEEMADLVDQYSHNCERMGVALTTFAEKHGATIQHYRDYERRIAASKRERLESQYKDRLHKAMVKLKPSHTECATNERVREAFQLM